MKITSSNMGGGSKAGIILLLLLVLACLLTIAGLAIAVGVYRNKLRSCRKSENYYRNIVNGTEPMEHCNCESTERRTITSSTSAAPTSFTSTAVTTVAACDSPDCFAVAGEVMSRMDVKANPCEDFYQYACGSYARPENRPPDQAVVQTFDLPQQRIQQLLYQILTSNGSDFHGSPSTAVQKSKDYYNACLNDTVDDKTGREILKQLFNYNPLGPANQTTFNIENSLASIHSLQIDGIVGLSIVEDPRNTSRYILALKPATLTLGDPAGYKKPNMDQAYKNYFAQVMSLIFESTANYSDLANILWSLESAIASIYPSAADIANPGNANNVVKLADIKNQSPYLNLTTLISKEFEASGVTINDNTEILIITPAYFASLNGVLSGLGSNTTLVVSSYLGWTVYNAMLPFAGPSFRDIHNNFYSTVSGSASQCPPQWKTCLDETLNVAGFAVGAAYTGAQVNDEDVQKVTTLLQNSKDDLISRLSGVTWMQDPVKQRALANANGLNWQIGFPQYFNSADKLDQYYRDLNVSGNHFQNAIAGRHFQVKGDISEYGKPVDSSEWIRNPTATYSYYNSATNQVLVQAGLLQKPMYDRSYPLAFDYGGIGSILGQKMMMLYGFRDNWWDQQTTNSYNTRAKCFIDQYNKESFNGIQVNGALTSVENIADTEGLKIAYDAYMKVSNNDKILPGLRLNGAQLNGAQQFFLGFTQLGCSNFDPARVSEVVQSSHVPSPVRVTVLLRNTPEFAQAFQCPDGSKMKPRDSDRCSL